MLLDALDHVQLAMPPGGEELAAWFYDEVLGIPRVPKPAALAVRGGCWFERGALRVHLGAQEGFVPATKAHPAFAVLDLDRLAQHLVDAGIPVQRVVDDDGPKVYADDPFGNRLEFRPERPSAPIGPVQDRAVAAAGDDAALAGLLAFATELDRLKDVRRQSLVLGGLRRENTAEHSWHVALLARAFARYAAPDVDVDRAVFLLLVHDIVEIDAGDTPIHDTAGAADKAARERAAADRIFGLLPEPEATEWRAAWDEYEAGDSAEARFAVVFDRLSPFLANVDADGLTWRRWRVDDARVRAVMAPVGDGVARLGEVVETLIAEAVEQRRLPRSSPLLDGIG